MQFYFLIESKKFLMNFESGILPKRKQGERLTSISDHVVRVAHIAGAAKVSDRKVFNHKQLKILIPKQTLQRLPIARVQVKTGNTSEKWNQANHIFFVSSKRNY